MKGIKIALIGLLLITTGLSIYNFFETKNLAYVNTASVYNKFQMKVELEKKLETATGSEKKKIKKKIDNIRKTARQNRKGTEHGRRGKKKRR